MPEISHPGDHVDCYLATTAQDDRLHWELMSVDQSCQRYNHRILAVYRLRKIKEDAHTMCKGFEQILRKQDKGIDINI